jgi:hypothetical protein
MPFYQLLYNMGCPYSEKVNFKRNLLRDSSRLLLPCFAALGAGCGGIGANGSVSPATFFLPGIGQVAPQQSPAATDGFLADNSAQVAANTGDSVR